MSSMSDNRFVAEQYRLHGQKVFKRCLAMTGGEAALAADVTQDVFVRLVEKARTLDCSSSLEGWLLTVAYRLCCQRLRRDRILWRRVCVALAAQPSAEAAPAREPRVPGGGVALGARMASSLRTLPPKERAALLMRYMDDLPQTQIAKALGYSEGYVSKLLSRGTERLRALDWETDDD